MRSLRQNTHASGILQKLEVTSCVRIWWSLLSLYLLVGYKCDVLEARVQQDSPCRAIVDNRVINLKPLQRLDGQPRFSTELNQTKYYYNPCVSFNVPKDNPHAGEGDKCYFVAMCMSSHKNTKENDASMSHNYYTLGIQSSIKFMNRPLYSTKIPIQIQDIFLEKYPGMSAIDNDIDPPNSREEIKDQSLGADADENDVNKDELISTESIEDEAEEKEYVYKKNDDSDENSFILNAIQNHNNTNTSGLYGNDTGIRVKKESGEDREGISSYSSSEESMSKITILCFKGVKNYKSTKTFVYLLCDHTKQRPEDATFRLIHIPNNTEKHFILQHQCSCPDGCPGDKPFQYSNGTELESEGEDGSGDEPPKHLWLVVVVNGGIIIMAVIIGGVLCRKGGTGNAGYYNMLPGLHGSRLTLGLSTESLFKGNRPKVNRPDYLEYSSALTKAGQMPTSNDGVIDSRDLEIGQRLGGGLFVDTYIAEWKECQVAAKRITVSVHQCQNTEEDHSWIIKELNYLSKQKHKHLILVLGICTDTKQPYVITEYFEGESIKDILNRQNEGLSWARKVKLCLQVADGMAFLHSAKYPIVHRDLRCANLLVDQSDRVKIVDYGKKKKVPTATLR